MHKVDSASADPQNEFTEGDPQAGTPATVVPAKWLNTVQRELVAVVEDAGLTLDDADDDQLLEAIALKIGAMKKVVASGQVSSENIITLTHTLQEGFDYTLHYRIHTIQGTEFQVCAFINGAVQVGNVLTKILLPNNFDAPTAPAANGYIPLGLYDNVVCGKCNIRSAGNASNNFIVQGSWVGAEVGIDVDTNIYWGYLTGLPITSITVQISNQTDNFSGKAWLERSKQWP